MLNLTFRPWSPYCFRLQTEIAVNLWPNCGPGFQCHKVGTLVLSKELMRILETSLVQIMYRWNAEHNMLIAMEPQWKTHTIGKIIFPGHNMTTLLTVNPVQSISCVTSMVN
jgi:hypothetical protein